MRRLFVPCFVAREARVGAQETVVLVLVLVPREGSDEGGDGARILRAAVGGGGGARAVVRARRRAGVDVIGIVADRKELELELGQRLGEVLAESSRGPRVVARVVGGAVRRVARARSSRRARARGFEGTRRGRFVRNARRRASILGRDARRERRAVVRRARGFGRGQRSSQRPSSEGAARAKDASRRRRGERLVDALRVDRSRATRRRGRLCRAHRHDAIDATGTPRESSVPPPRARALGRVDAFKLSPWAPEGGNASVERITVVHMTTVARTV